MTCRVQASDDLPFGWERKGGLISVCAWCVDRGLVPAPPMDVRTDSICPPHADEFLAPTRARLAAKMTESIQRLR